MEVVEITTKTSEYYINLVDKTAIGFDRINSDFESSFAVNKMVLLCIVYTFFFYSI